VVAAGIRKVVAAGIRKEVVAGIRKAVVVGVGIDNIVVEEAALAADWANLAAFHNYRKTLTRKQRGCRIWHIDTIAAFNLYQL
jgi:hypothetical protein